MGRVAGSLDAARWTQGLVTPTLLAALERAGADRSFDALAAGRADLLLAGRRMDVSGLERR